MENPSHSFCRTQSSKKLYNDHGFAAKAVYDDVFGGLPRFGAPTFSPRSEDYCEIFGAFKASRGSSIPFLDLPVVGETELLFDVRGSNFDYSDIFGGFNGRVDFAVSYEQLLQQSEKGDDSSDKAWTPTESEYLSEESDPPARAAMHQIFSNRDSHQSFDDIMQFNDSCCETNYKNSEDISNWMMHGNHLRSVSEISSVDDESSSMQTNKEKKTSLKVTDDVNFYVDLNKEMMGQKHFRKTKSLSAKDSAGLLQTFGSDSKAQRRYYYHVFHPNETLITVSDISLRTCPSQVSPPSRLPPVLDIEKGNYEAPTNCAFVGTPDDSSLPSFDVEVDASSSAAGSAHVIKDALGKAQVNLRGVKELMDKKEVLRNSMNLGLKNDVKDKEGKEDKTVDGSKILVKEKLQENCVADDNRVDAFVAKQKQEPKETSDIFTDAIEEESLLNAAEMSARKKHGKNSKDPYRTDGTGEWKEAMDFFELRTEVRGADGWEKNNRTVKEGIEAHEGNKTESRSKAAKVAHSQEEHAKNVKVVNTEQKESDQKSNIGWKHNIFEEKLTEVDKWEGHEKLTRKHEVELKDALKLQYRFEHEDKMKVGKFEEIEKKLEKAWKGAVNEDKSNNDFEKAEHEKRLQEILEKEENMKIFKEVPRWAELDFRKEESEQRFNISLEQQENKNKVVLENEEDKKRLKEVFELEDNAKESKEAVLQEGDEDKQLHANEREVTEKRHKENCELEMLEKRLEEAWGREEEEILEEARERKRNGKKSRGASESKKVEDRSKQPGKLEKVEPWLKCSGEQNKVTALCTSHEQNERGRTVNKLKLAHKNSLLMEGDNLKFSGGTSKQEDYKNLQETQVACKHEGNSGKLGKAQLACAREENEKVKIEAEDDRKQLGAVKMAKALSEEGFRATRMVQFHSELEDNGIRMKDSEESLTSSYNSFGNGQTQNQKEKKASSVDFDSKSLKENICHDWDGKGKTVSRGQVFSDPKPNNNASMSAHQVKEKVEIGRTVEVQSTAMQGRGNTQKIAQQVNLNHIKNRKEKKDIHASEEKELMKKEQELEKDRLRKMEEEIEREKEREKDRMAVEIATCEARAWANIEAHERAERAAVESANAVAWQRALGEAQVRSEKECAREKSVAEKVYMEGRPGVERVAVERATADSWEHAVERELVERAPDDARERVEADKYSASSQDVGITGSTSSSDLQRRVYSSGFSHPNASGCAGIDIESAQRCKARLERHRRTSERAAKALAEKNMRDLLAQREQAERIRLAETLDAEIKRWSNGKEGNLRALLSTLQYILGTGSGWQPIPLTDVITAVAVKKAYRKATLCVHPDKLQQRGASIHQKYICEKVFDLLKEAWNKFNSEER